MLFPTEPNLEWWLHERYLTAEEEKTFQSTESTNHQISLKSLRLIELANPNYANSVNNGTTLTPCRFRIFLNLNQRLTHRHLINLYFPERPQRLSH